MEGIKSQVCKTYCKGEQKNTLALFLIEIQNSDFMIMWVSRRNHLIFIVLISSSTSAYLFLVWCMKVLVEKIGVPSLKTGDESVIVNGGSMKLRECLCP